MNELLTVGYEGTDVEKFVAELDKAGVDLLVDVRMVPFSRKAGFTQGPLERVLGAAGIDYLHLRDLGNPKIGRDAAKAGDEATFRSVYMTQMATPPARRALATVVDLGRSRRPCLMCFERDHRHCHRGMVAEAVEAQGLAVRHLVPAEREKSLRTREKTAKTDAQGTLF